MRKFALQLAAALLAASPMAAAATPTPVADSDLFGYQLNSIAYTWQDISGSGTPITPWTNGTDDGYNQLSLPFTFRFYGNPYTKVSVATNGYLQFGTTSSFSGNDPLTNPSISPQNIVALLWQDLDLSASGTVYYEIQGSAPNRVAVIQYEAVPLFDAVPPGPPVSFQARLFETSNAIEVYYADTANAGAGLQAAAGLRSLNDCPNRTSLPHVFQSAELPSGLALRYTAPSPEPSCGTPTYTLTFTITQTHTVSPTYTHTPTITETFTVSPTPTITPSITQTYTDSPTSTHSPTASPTQTPTYTASPSFSATATHTPLPSASPTFTTSPSNTPTPLALSDLYGYQLFTQPFNWNDISSSGTAVSTWTNGNDDGWIQLSLPFNFNFYGNPYSKVTVATNGYLQFGTVSSFSGNDPLSTDISPNNVIALYWEDLTLASSGTVYTEIQGGIGNRVAVIQFDAVPRFTGGGSITLQARLYENGFHIEVDYLSVASAGAGIGAAAGLRSLYDCGNRNSLPWVYQSAEISDQLSLRYEAPVPSPACGTVTNTPTASPSSTITQTFTYSPTATSTFTHSPSPSHTPTSTITYTSTITLTHTNTPSFTHSPTITQTHTITPTFSNSPTFSHSPTITPTFTNSPTFSHSPTITPTFSISPTFTVSPTATPTYTTSPTPSHSPTRTASTTRSVTHTYSPTGTHTSTITQTFSHTDTPTHTPTATPSDTPTVSQTFTVTRTATPTATKTASPTRTITPYPPAAIPACLVLGQLDLNSNFTGSPNVANMNYPGAVVVDTRYTPYRIYVSDTGHHRILIYNDAEGLQNGLPADGVIGQANFVGGLANRGGSPDADTLNSPGQMGIDGLGNLWVADTGNHRVLRFPVPPLVGAAADMVLGQSGSFTSNTANLGGVSADSLNGPTALALGFFGEVFVADTGNHRVLRFNNPAFPTASNVLGQGGSFTSNTPNLGGVSKDSLDTPSGLAWEFEHLFVADTGNHRVLRYNTNPLVVSAQGVLGQASMNDNLPNRGFANTAGNRLSSPLGLALDPGKRLYVSDSGNNRVLGFWPWDDPTANQVWGQAGGFVSTAGLGANLMDGPASIAVPDGLTLVVADRNNHRVTIYECGESLRMATPTYTNSPTHTVTITKTPTPTGTISPTHSTTPSVSATLTTTLTPNPADTATTTPTVTPTLTVTPSTTPSVTPTVTMTFSASPTATQTLTLVPTETPYPRLTNRSVAYPNPVPRSAGRHCIAFPPAKAVDIWIHNLLGERIYRLDGNEINPARGWACWGLRSSGGVLLSPGIYYYRAQVDGKNYLGKFTVN